jgi:HJR/Mrr/RecB family endonuclease
LEGALAGYLSLQLGITPGFTVTQSKGFTDGRADIVVERGSQKILVELKRTASKTSVTEAVRRAVMQASPYLHEEGVVGVVAFIYSLKDRNYEVTRAGGILADRVRIIAPHTDKPLPT